MRQQHAQDAVDGLAFGAWLRSGLVPDDVAELRRGLEAGTIELKFNPTTIPPTAGSHPGPAGRERHVPTAA